MNTLLLGLRVLLFALSTFGYLTVLHKKTKLPVEFLPAIVFCGQICVLFAAGILNLLSLSIWHFIRRRASSGCAFPSGSQTVPGFSLPGLCVFRAVLSLLFTDAERTGFQFL